MSARIVGPDAAGVAAAAVVVRAGGVLLYPTETVYGLGGDAARDAVIAKIRSLKGRDADKPMLALTDEWARVEDWLAGVTDTHRRLMAHPGPLTLLFDASDAAPPGLVGPEGYVGIRRTSDPFCRAVIAAADRPLLSTSANPSGVPPPVRFADVDRALLGRVALAVDAGQPLAGQPSTVVKVDDGAVVVVREGAVAAEALREGV